MPTRGCRMCRTQHAGVASITPFRSPLHCPAGAPIRKPAPAPAAPPPCRTAAAASYRRHPSWAAYAPAACADAAVRRRPASRPLLQLRHEVVLVQALQHRPTAPWLQHLNQPQEFLFPCPFRGAGCRTGKPATCAQRCALFCHPSFPNYAVRSSKSPVRTTREHKGGDTT